jgi:hypothetical protein
MVALLSPSVYGRKEIADRLFVAGRIYEQHIPSRFAVRLPWSKRDTSTLLDGEMHELLSRTVEYVTQTGLPRTILINDADFLWVVRVQPYANGLKLTWRYVCRDEQE